LLQIYGYIIDYFVYLKFVVSSSKVPEHLHKLRAELVFLKKKFNDVIASLYKLKMGLFRVKENSKYSVI
jgi:hypothetical protein